MDHTNTMVTSGDEYRAQELSMSENQEQNQSDKVEAEETASATDQVFAENEFEEAGFDAERQSADNSETNDKDDQYGEPVSENEVESLKQQLADKEDQLLRSVADTENIRKRARRESEEARKYAATALLTDLLTVVDDLHRALESAEQNEESQGLLDGVKMVASQLDSVLEKHHCKKIEAKGKAFDPNLHEAIQMQPSEDVEANHISLEARTGYQFHDRVLRTAQVFVSTGKPVSSTEDVE